MGDSDRPVGQPLHRPVFYLEHLIKRLGDESVMIGAIKIASPPSADRNDVKDVKEEGIMRKRVKKQQAVRREGDDFYEAMPATPAAPVYERGVERDYTSTGLVVFAALVIVGLLLLLWLFSRGAGFTPTSQPSAPSTNIQLPSPATQ